MKSNVLTFVHFYSQSTHNILIVENFDTKNVGTYLCKAENSLGSASKNVSVTITLAPKVKVVPDKMAIKKGDAGSLECVVEGNHGDFKILWKDEFDILAVKVRECFIDNKKVEPFET